MSDLDKFKKIVEKLIGPLGLTTSKKVKKKRGRPRKKK
mgnify:CR=1 FL=1|tara:strand:+ start:457 stop:570 length:114 start_codon:yes stop_codon:yes gene_type:complete